MRNSAASVAACHRRDFLKLAALAGAGVALGFPVATRAAALPAAGPSLTQLAWFDDAVQLARRVPAFPTALHPVLAPDISTPVPGNIARLVGTTHFAPAQWAAYLNKQRGGDLSDEKARQRLATALGGLTYAVVGDTWKPQAANDGEVARAYRDAALLRARSADVRNPTPEAVTAFFEAMEPRTFTRFHTLIPDYDDALAWTLRMARWRDDALTYYGRVALAYARADAALTRRYLTAPNFYDATDAVLRSIATAGPLQPATLPPARSQYARAVQRGMTTLVRAVAFYQGELSEQELLKS